MKDKCNICEGIGWLREDKDVNEDGFGKLVRCICNPEPPEEIPEPLPEPHPFLLKWQDYTD